MAILLAKLQIIQIRPASALQTIIGHSPHLILKNKRRLLRNRNPR